MVMVQAAKARLDAAIAAGYDPDAEFRSMLGRLMTDDELGDAEVDEDRQSPQAQEQKQSTTPDLDTEFMEQLTEEERQTEADVMNPVSHCTSFKHLVFLAARPRFDYHAHLGSELKQREHRVTLVLSVPRPGQSSGAHVAGALHSLTSRNQLRTSMLRIAYAVTLVLSADPILPRPCSLWVHSCTCGGQWKAVCGAFSFREIGRQYD